MSPKRNFKTLRCSWNNLDVGWTHLGEAEAQARLEQGDEDARFLLGVEVPDSWKGGLLGDAQLGCLQKVAAFWVPYSQVDTAWYS